MWQYRDPKTGDLDFPPIVSLEDYKIGMWHDFGILYDDHFVTMFMDGRDVTSQHPLDIPKRQGTIDCGDVTIGGGETRNETFKGAISHIIVYDSIPPPKEPQHGNHVYWPGMGREAKP